MNIIGPDSLVFGVDDVSACCQYFTDYGLSPVDVDEKGGHLEALDGTSVVIRHRDDPALPPALPTGATIRKTIYGVADQATLDAIEAELSKDREVRHLNDGSLESVDDMGFVLGFQVTVRRQLDLPAEIVNAPGSASGREINALGVTPHIEAKPRSLSHVVYFVPDYQKAEAFYRDRLGFVTVDRFTHLGPFMRPAGTKDHHTLFMIQTPPAMLGVEHFTFHVGGPTELLVAGKRFCDKGYESFWGPGRHILGSNWFWYFNSPLGVHVEYDADMDFHDDSWEAREMMPSADTSQIFNFTLARNWLPGAPE